MHLYEIVTIPMYQKDLDSTVIFCQPLFTLQVCYILRGKCTQLKTKTSPALKKLTFLYATPKPHTLVACTLHALSIAWVVNVDAFWRETRDAKQLRTVGLGVLGIGSEISTETV